MIRRATTGFGASWPSTPTILLLLLVVVLECHSVWATCARAEVGRTRLIEIEGTYPFRQTGRATASPYEVILLDRPRLCNDSLRGLMPISMCIDELCQGSLAAILSLASSPFKPRERRSHYVMVPYAHDTIPEVPLLFSMEQGRTMKKPIGWLRPRGSNCRQGVAFATWKLITEHVQMPNEGTDWRFCSSCFEQASVVRGILMTATCVAESHQTVEVLDDDCTSSQGVYVRRQGSAREGGTHLPKRP
ncbi:hypothetical protein TgHK011_000559 [Trichoderma gracile]|nr:hypothetical protein TgHK011_000559 [Trichoderma gracile]